MTDDLQNLKKTARLAGLAYLALAVAGALGFLFVRAKLYVPGDAARTAANLVAQQTLARFGIAADLAVVLTQAVAALWFFKLFRSFDSFAAGALAAFGLINSVAVLVGTMFSATALELAVSGGSTPEVTLMLYELTGAAWKTGGLFFGLWLIPMGWLAWRSKWMPSALAWVLMVGGVGYIVSAFVGYCGPGFAGLTQALPIPASIGEFWMIGYLLAKGVRATA
jgi:Domain of unknown function (DUF4386)